MKYEEDDYRDSDMTRVSVTMDDMEDAEEETFYDWLAMKLDEMFVSSLPMDAIRDLPPLYMYSVGIVVQALALALFCFFIYSGYSSGMTQEFMSLQSDAGDCSEVAAPITGSFLADFNGHWESNAKFDYSLAIYRFDFQALTVTTAQFYRVVQYIESKMAAFGSLGKKENLAGNLLLWMTVSFGVPTSDSNSELETIQYFQLTSFPQYVFNRQYIQGAIINQSSYCVAPSIGLFDEANALLSLGYKYEDYQSLGCNGMMPAVALGYDPYLNDNEFTVRLHVNSLIVAMGVNLGTLSLVGDTQTAVTINEVANAETVTVVFEGGVYVGKQYIDSLYPGMKPILCFTLNGFVDGYADPYVPQFNVTCGVMVGGIFGYPLFNHYGAYYDPSADPTPCQCSLEGGPSTTWTPYCNSFDLMVGLVLFEPTIATDYSAVLPILYMRKSNPGAVTLNDAAFNATHAAASLVYPDANPLLNDTEWRERAFEFCTIESLSNTSCSIMSFNLYDNISNSISAFNYQLLHGSCNDSTYIPPSAWNELGSVPPTVLTQDYYKCTEYTYSALFNAVGIASGNVATVIPVAVVFLLPVMFMFMSAIGQIPPKEEYRKEEKDDAIEALAKQLLRLRDGKTRGMKKGGVLHNLTVELIDAARQEGGYPDSDDSESDSDPEDEPDKPILPAPVAPKRRPIASVVYKRGGQNASSNAAMPLQSVQDAADSDDEGEGRLTIAEHLQQITTVPAPNQATGRVIGTALKRVPIPASMQKKIDSDDSDDEVDSTTATGVKVTNNPGPTRKVTESRYGQNMYKPSVGSRPLRSPYASTSPDPYHGRTTNRLSGTTNMTGMTGMTGMQTDRGSLAGLYAHGGRKVKGKVFAKQIEERYCGRESNVNFDHSSQCSKRNGHHNRNSTAEMQARETHDQGNMTATSSGFDWSWLGFGKKDNKEGERPSEDTANPIHRGSTSVSGSGWDNRHTEVRRKHRKNKKRADPDRYERRSEDIELGWTEMTDSPPRESTSARPTGNNRKENLNNKSKPKLHSNPSGIRLSEFNSSAEYQDMMVLNAVDPDEPLDDPDTPKYVLKDSFLPIEKMHVVLSDLRRLLGECILYERESVVGTDAGAGAEVALDGKGKVARDCPSFRKVAMVASYLSKVDLPKLLTTYTTDKKLYIQMHTLLCMHAGVAFNLDVKDITDKYSGHIAYQLGERIFSAHDIHSLCGDDSAFRDSIAGGDACVLLSAPAVLDGGGNDTGGMDGII